MISRTIPQKVSDWLMAYNAVRAELTPAEMRTILAEMKQVDGIDQFKSYVSLASAVMANDRSAGLIAAMLTSNGIKPAFVDLDAGDD